MSNVPDRDNYHTNNYIFLSAQNKRDRLTDWNVLKHEVYSILISQCDTVFCHLVSGEGETE